MNHLVAPATADAACDADVAAEHTLQGGSIPDSSRGIHSMS